MCVCVYVGCYFPFQWSTPNGNILLVTPFIRTIWECVGVSVLPANIRRVEKILPDVELRTVDSGVGRVSNRVQHEGIMEPWD